MDELLIHASGNAGSLVTAAGLVLARILPVVLLVPYLGGRLVPFAAKMGLALALSAVLLPRLSMEPALAALSMGELALVAFKEVLVGVAIGFLGALVFYGAQMVGALIDTSHGQTLATALVPGLPDRASPTGGLLVLLLVVTYVSLNGHHLLIRALAGSYSAVPLVILPGSPEATEPLVWGLVAVTGELFWVALAISVPFLAAVLLVDLALGVASRIAPQLHAFFLGLPAKSMLVIVLLLLGLAAVTDLLVSEVDRSIGWVRWFLDTLR